MSAAPPKVDTRALNASAWLRHDSIGPTVSDQLTAAALRLDYLEAQREHLIDYVLENVVDGDVWRQTLSPGSILLILGGAA